MVVVNLGPESCSRWKDLVLKGVDVAAFRSGRSELYASSPACEVSDER